MGCCRAIQGHHWCFPLISSGWGELNHILSQWPDLSKSEVWSKFPRYVTLGRKVGVLIFMHFWGYSCRQACGLLSGQGSGLLSSVVNYFQWKESKTCSKKLFIFNLFILACFWCHCASFAYCFKSALLFSLLIGAQMLYFNRIYSQISNKDVWYNDRYVNQQSKVTRFVARPFFEGPI